MYSIAMEFRLLHCMQGTLRHTQPSEFLRPIRDIFRSIGPQQRLHSVFRPSGCERIRRGVLEQFRRLLFQLFGGLCVRSSHSTGQLPGSFIKRVRNVLASTSEYEVGPRHSNTAVRQHVVDIRQQCVLSLQRCDFSRISRVSNLFRALALTDHHEESVLLALSSFAFQRDSAASLLQKRHVPC